MGPRSTLGHQVEKIIERFLAQLGERHVEVFQPRHSLQIGYRSVGDFIAADVQPEDL